jgi:hypothetical protein
MSRRFFPTAIIFSMVFFWSCHKDKTITDISQPAENDEYVILFGAPESAEDNWFTVIHISDGDARGVPAVVELEGGIYLPTMSRLPTYHDKVLEGYFVPDTNYFEALIDTIFHVTKHLRDTTITFWGG